MLPGLCLLLILRWAFYLLHLDRSIGLWPEVSIDSFEESTFGMMKNGTAPQWSDSPAMMCDYLLQADTIMPSARTSRLLKLKMLVCKHPAGTGYRRSGHGGRSTMQ